MEAGFCLFPLIQGLQINADGVIAFLLNDNNGVWNTIVTGSGSLSQDTWHYVAITYNETTANVYVDGALDNSNDISFDIPTNYNLIYIGAIDNDINASADYQHQFVGTIDELRISKDVWTATEILDYYNSNK